MSYTVAINTAGRAEVLCRKTLPMLIKGGVPVSAIELWVPSEDEQRDYMMKLSLEGIPFGSINVAPHDPEDKRLEVVGVEPVGLGKARNHTLREHQAGDRVLFIDDDIKSIDVMVHDQQTGKATLTPVRDIDNLFHSMFAMTHDRGATLCGIYPVRNAFFMKKRINHKLTYICGGLFGVIVDHKPYQFVTLDDKEDFERSVRHYQQDGRVLRWEYVAIGTTGYQGAGGMQLSRTPERVRRACTWMVETYPKFCRINTGKRSEWAEVKLSDMRVAASTRK